MKCPVCKSDKFYSIKTDPLLMGCEDCHSMVSVPWAIGYWIGYCDGEREAKAKSNEILEGESE